MRRYCIKYFITIILIFTIKEIIRVDTNSETLPLTAEEMSELTAVRDEILQDGKINFDSFNEILKQKNPILAEKISQARDSWNSKFDNLETDAKAWMEEVRNAKPKIGETLTSDEMINVMIKIRKSFNELSDEAKHELEENFPAVVKQMGIENSLNIISSTVEPEK
uniref:DUF148 domain-containing protein n=1 Tax=Parastrongyloides trichosuri TaxID=131310 RepID=A0A0N5A5K9_PARTI